MDQSKNEIIEVSLVHPSHTAHEQIQINMCIEKKKEKLFFGGEGDIQEVISSHKCYMKSTNT